MAKARTADKHNLRPADNRIDFIGVHKWIGFAITGVCVAITIFSLLTKGLNFGIDFTGGIVIEARTETPADMKKLRSIFDGGNFGEVSLQSFGDPRDFMIRLQASNEGEQQKIAEKIKATLDEKYGEKIEYRKVDYVGPQVGGELIRSSFIAVGLALVAIMCYLWARFEWQYGIGGLLALFHDTIITTGFFSVTQIEFNLTSIAALLTIIGYSINDSVVIYDRIRENFRKYKSMDKNTIINVSVNQTLSRTLMTAGTVLLATFALMIFGGGVIFGFSAAMFFGVIIGTHSSIYVSATSLTFFKLKR